MKIIEGSYVGITKFCKKKPVGDYYGSTLNPILAPFLSQLFVTGL